MNKMQHCWWRVKLAKGREESMTIFSMPTVSCFPARLQCGFLTILAAGLNLVWMLLCETWLEMTFWEALQWRIRHEFPLDFLQILMYPNVHRRSQLWPSVFGSDMNFEAQKFRCDRQWPAQFSAFEQPHLATNHRRRWIMKVARSWNSRTTMTGRSKEHTTRRSLKPFRSLTLMDLETFRETSWQRRRADPLVPVKKIHNISSFTHWD